ncbi:MAG: cell envelope integrity protein TolA [Methylotenera sp.]|nr:cell envelope integrity protein TolA [Methylotenera sp.]MSP98973.1 cell envelope integrity protein TolA [Methylotenera sp.]
MIRAYEKEVSWQAGGLAVAVHLALLGALLISFNWKAAHPAFNVTEVELWDSLPNVQEPTPVPPKPIIEEQAKPAPELKEEPKVEPKPEPTVKEEPKIDIALEKKLKDIAQKKADDRLKKDKALEQKKQVEALQADVRKDETLNNDKLLKESKTKEAIKKMQQEALVDERAAGDQPTLSAGAMANAGVVDEFRNKIQAKIRGNVNKTLCGNANPELKFDIGLLASGELSGAPKLVKSSGSAACDEAVERAIMASQPLPLPSDASLFSQFRNLKLKFRPND